eukprot:scaffold25165_cov72-Cyclotella_meneghiniana.AAC.1
MSNGSGLILNDATERENPKCGGNSGSLSNSVIADSEVADAFHSSALTLKEVLKGETKKIVKPAIKLDKTGNKGLDFDAGTDTMINDSKKEVAKAFNAASEVPDTAGDAGLGVDGGADDMLKDGTSEIAMISKAGDATLDDSKKEAAKAFEAASELPDTNGDAGLQFDGGADVMLKDMPSEIAMIAKAGDATVIDSKMEAAKAFNAASEVPDTIGNAGLEFFDGIDAMLKNTTLETVMISKAKMEAASEIPDTTGNAGLALNLDISIITRPELADMFHGFALAQKENFNVETKEIVKLAVEPDESGNIGFEFEDGADATLENSGSLDNAAIADPVLKDVTAKVAIANRPGDSKLNDCKTEVAKVASEGFNTPDNAGLDFDKGTDANRSTLKDMMKTNIGEVVKSTFELDDTAGNTGLKFDESADAMLGDMVIEVGEVAKATASELDNTVTVKDGFVLDDGTLKASSVSPSTGPRKVFKSIIINKGAVSSMVEVGEGFLDAKQQEYNWKKNNK